jgi:hypothetical protein
MGLDRLRELVPPPEKPVETGTADGWAEVERALGTPLPADFKAFTNLYGSGAFDGFLYLFNPFTAGEDGNLLHERGAVLDGYATSRARFPDRYPLPPFPEPGGVLPAGRTDNGDELYWVTEGEPDAWHVVVLGARGAKQETHHTTITGFLAALLSGDLSTSLFPEDFRERRDHAFTPFD